MIDPVVPAPDRDGTAAVTLVLVSGSGRSGTSTLAGSLKRLGMHVPQPEVEASATNPRGFYEPRWVIDFHKGHLRDVGVVNIDSRPAAVEVMAGLMATAEPREQLKGWLATQLDSRLLVVKDPHAFWFAEIWREVCDELGITLKWLTAVRHPAEVVGSRDLAYRQGRSEAARRIKETSNVAGWVHAALLTERVGRGVAEAHGRAFIKYADLLADWRAALGPVEQQLELDFNTDLASRAHHEVEDFIEPTLRSSQLTWDDLSTPGWLKQMAQEVWELLGCLVIEPADVAVMARLDEIHADYDERYAEALALTADHSEAVRARTAKRVRRRLTPRIQRLRGEIKAAHALAGNPSHLPGWLKRRARALRG